MDCIPKYIIQDTWEGKHAFEITSYHIVIYVLSRNLVSLYSFRQRQLLKTYSGHLSTIKVTITGLGYCPRLRIHNDVEENCCPRAWYATMSDWCMTGKKGQIHSRCWITVQSLSNRGKAGKEPSYSSSYIIQNIIQNCTFGWFDHHSV